MAAATLKLFLGQSEATQYADLVSAGVKTSKESENYIYGTERYTFLTAKFIVTKRYGVVQEVMMESTKIPPLA